MLTVVLKKRLIVIVALFVMMVGSMCFCGAAFAAEICPELAWTVPSSDYSGTFTLSGLKLPKEFSWLAKKYAMCQFWLPSDYFCNSIGVPLRPDKVFSVTDSKNKNVVINFISFDSNYYYYSGAKNVLKVHFGRSDMENKLTPVPILVTSGNNVVELITLLVHNSGGEFRSLKGSMLKDKDSPRITLNVNSDGSVNGFSFVNENKLPEAIEGEISDLQKAVSSKADNAEMTTQFAAINDQIKLLKELIDLKANAADVEDQITSEIERKIEIRLPYLSCDQIESLVMEMFCNEDGDLVIKLDTLNPALFEGFDNSELQLAIHVAEQISDKAGIKNSVKLVQFTKFGEEYRYTILPGTTDLFVDLCYANTGVIIARWSPSK